MRNQQQVLRAPFDVQTHKRTFINYLEVIILESGEVVYAVPSHQEKMIHLACEKLGVTREELNDLCPAEYYGDFMVWLSKVSGAIPVWNAFYDGSPNKKQMEVLKTLLFEGLYGGNIRENNS